MSNCGVIYATGDPAAPAKRCSKKAEKGKGSPCVEHRRHLELLNEPGREAVKARYEAVVLAYEEHERITKAKGDYVEVARATAAVRRAVRGRT